MFVPYSISTDLYHCTMLRKLIYRDTCEKDDRKAEQAYLLMIQRVQDEGPMSAYRLFQVDLSILTRQLAIILTYLFILIDFKLCPPASGVDDNLPPNPKSILIL